MPSPTSRTLPTSLTSVRAPKSLISCLRTETISPALNFMGGSLNEMGSDRFQAGPHAAVVQPVGDADDETADQFGIHGRLDDRLLAEQGAGLVADAVNLALGERHRRADLNADAVLP